MLKQVQQHLHYPPKHGGHTFSTAAPSYGILPQNISKYINILNILKQKLENFYSGNVSIDSHA